MEQVLESVVTVLGAITAGMFAMAPGMIFWLVVITVFKTIRGVRRSGPFQMFLHQDGIA
jgi:hypothetical protein